MIEKYIKEFKELFPERKLLFVCEAGSHFFNLNSPNSDRDYKGVYLSSPKEYYEGKGDKGFFDRTTNLKQKTKNTGDDVDFSLFSYSKYLELLKRGDFNCMELLYTPEDKVILTTPEFQELQMVRDSLLVNDISAFLGFIKKEYRRYGVNINHYDNEMKFLQFLEKYADHTRLKTIWTEVKEFAKDFPLITFTTSLTGNNNRVPSLKIAQRLYQDTVSVGYVRDAINDRIKRYGHRQKNNAESGKEFKGLYHAMRLIYEANDLFEFGSFQFPFDESRHTILRKIKDGNVEQELLFAMIDYEIDRLYRKEKEFSCKSNRSSVEHLIDKLLFQKEGTMKLRHRIDTGKWEGPKRLPIKYRFDVFLADYLASRNK